MTTLGSMSGAAEILSRPFTINGLTVPNRIVMSPMTRMHSPAASRARTSPPATHAAPPMSA